MTINKFFIIIGVSVPVWMERAADELMLCSLISVLNNESQLNIFLGIETQTPRTNTVFQI